jgi:Rieske Fe-S protein
MSETTRRSVLAGAAGITAAVTLSACAKKEGEDAGQAAGSQASTAASKAGDAASKAASGLAAAADIPVGSGKIFADQKVVVTQPTQGNFKAFDTTCTHAGCPVSKVEGGLIHCECHGSQYKVADGSVAKGPATKGLAAKTVKLENGQLKLG